MFDVIVVGCGVAGMTAALYALRNNKKVLIIDKESYGGQIAKSPKVENYPTKKSISGSDLVDEIFEQISDLGVIFELEDVSKIERQGNNFLVTTNYNSYETKSVIIATGVAPRKLNLENEEKFLGKGVFYCALCDGPFFAGKEVSIVGDGNSAMQYALMLANYCTKVKLYTMFDKFFGEKNLELAVRKNDKIEIIPNTVATRLLGDDKLTQVEYKSGDKLFTEDTEGLFVAIGQVPCNDMFGDIVQLDQSGYIIADESCCTSTSGIFVAGDCRTKTIRQVPTAIGDGAVAGTEVVKYLDMVE